MRLTSTSSTSAKALVKQKMEEKDPPLGARLVPGLGRPKRQSQKVQEE
jgi:hypothetical protein